MVFPLAMLKCWRTATYPCTKIPARWTSHRVAGFLFDDVGAARRVRPERAL